MIEDASVLLRHSKDRSPSLNSAETMMRLASCASLLICALALAQPAAAHPVPFSYLDLRLENNTLDVSLIVHIFDVAHDLGIAPMERLLESDVVAASGAAMLS